MSNYAARSFACHLEVGAIDPIARGVGEPPLPLRINRRLLNLVRVLRELFAKHARHVGIV